MRPLFKIKVTGGEIVGLLKEDDSWNWIEDDELIFSCYKLHDGSERFECYVDHHNIDPIGTIYDVTEWQAKEWGYDEDENSVWTPKDALTSDMIKNFNHELPVDLGTILLILIKE